MLSIINKIILHIKFKKKKMVLPVIKSDHEKITKNKYYIVHEIYCISLFNFKYPDFFRDSFMIK